MAITQDGSQAQGTTSVTRTFTAGALGVLHCKWEGGATPSTSFSDGTNTWTRLGFANSTQSGSQPGNAIFYCLSMTSGSRTITPTFSAGTPTFQRTECESFISGTGSWVTDLGFVSSEDNGGGGGGHTYTMAANTVAANSVSVFCVSEFNSLATLTSTGGSPAFTVTAGINADSFMVWLISATSQSVTPGATVASGWTRAVESSASFKEDTGISNNQLAWIKA
jgi:hypothetical protein